jgi:Tol biopolymer transport system component
MAARELFSINLPNGDETRLTNNEVEDVDPSFSPDGTTIAFTRADHTWLMDIDGTNERPIASGTQPSFSPHGQDLVLIAGQFGRRIDIVHVDGSERRTLYSENSTVEHPTFSPDGKSVVFFERGSESRIGDIVLMDLSGTVLRRIPVNSK